MSLNVYFDYLGGFFLLLLFFEKKKIDPARIGTWNPLIRSQMPYPLGHRAVHFNAKLVFVCLMLAMALSPSTSHGLFTFMICEHAPAYLRQIEVGIFLEGVGEYNRSTWSMTKRLSIITLIISFHGSMASKQLTVWKQ